MYFLFTNALLARGIKTSPVNLVFTFILLGSALDALLFAQKVNGLGWYVLVPLLSLLSVKKIPELSHELQTSLGVFTVIVTLLLLLVILPPQAQQITLQVVAAAWTKFRAFTVAVPCMCILLRIVTINPNQLNLLLFGIPIVACAGFSLFAIRLLLG